MCSSARTSSALCRSAIASVRSRQAPLAYRRRSVATWSFRLRPVCSLPPAGPASSMSRRSTAVWMSSSPAWKANVPRLISSEMCSSPATIASCSAAGSTPMACSMAACATEPAMSPGSRRRSTSIPAVYSSTAGDVSSPRRPAQTFGAASSAIVAAARVPLHLEWSFVVERALYAGLRAQWQAEQLDEAARGRVVEAVVSAVVRRQVGLVQRSRRLASHHAGFATAQPHAYRAGDVLLRGSDKGVQRETQRAKPEAVVHQPSPLVADPLLELLYVTRQRHRLQRAVRRMQHDSRGRFIDLSRRDPDQPVLHMVDPSHAVLTGHVVEAYAQLFRRHRCAVERTRHAVVESDLHDDRFCDHRLGVHGPGKHIGWRLVPWILEHPTLDAASPQICVHRIGRRLRQ